MGAIKVKDPEQEPKPNQDSPSKEIINALAFIGSAVLIISIFYNAYQYHIASDKLSVSVYQEISFAIGSIVSVVLAIWMIFKLTLLLFGEYDDWLKENIDPYLLKIKSWLNRRNEQ